MLLKSFPLDRHEASYASSAHGTHSTALSSISPYLLGFLVPIRAVRYIHAAVSSLAILVQKKPLSQVLFASSVAAHQHHARSSTHCARPPCGGPCASSLTLHCTVVRYIRRCRSSDPSSFRPSLVATLHSCPLHTPLLFFSSRY
jgi:hypothetical protein